MPSDSALERLAELLSASGALPDISLERLAPSTVYDLEYRVAVVALAFRLHSATDQYSTQAPRIQGRRLKLLQFAAMRPWLVGVIREWSESRHDAERSLETEEGLKRGFISDTMHDDVIDFLVAAGALRRDELFVLPGLNSSIISDMIAEAETGQLFSAELTALRHLKGITITNEMLEGW